MAGFSRGSTVQATPRLATNDQPQLSPRRPFDRFHHLDRHIQPVPETAATLAENLVGVGRSESLTRNDRNHATPRVGLTNLRFGDPDGVFEEMIGAPDARSVFELDEVLLAAVDPLEDSSRQPATTR